MEETKRKTKTSAAVKNRYNAKVYDGITVKLRKDLVKAFKEKCAAEGISQAQVSRLEKGAISAMRKSVTVS